MKFSIHVKSRRHKAIQDHAGDITHTRTDHTSHLEAAVILARLFAQVEKIQDLLTTAEKSATS
jgi:hypothetical protein